MSRMMRSVWRACPSATAVVAASLMLGLLCGCAAEPIGVSTPHIKGTLYLKHNLRCFQDGLTKIAFNSSYLSAPQILKAGTPVNIFLFSADRLDMTVENDLQLRMFHHDVPFPTDQNGIGLFIEKHFARNRKEVDDLRAAVSVDSRNAADNSKPQFGMTKEEIIYAIGYPAQIEGVQPADLLTREQILNANQWVYYNSKPWYLFGLGQERWVFEFDVENKLRTIIR